MNAPIKVLVVDDSPDITELLSYLIGVEPRLECVGCRQSADGLADDIHRLQPDILVLDASMPGKDPITALAECRIEFPGLRAVVYSGYDDSALIERVIDAAAWGFVSKREAPNVVVRAILAVAAGQVVFPVKPSRPTRPEPRSSGRSAAPLPPSEAGEHC